MRLTFAIPDIHGRFDLLTEALRLIKERAEKGTIVFLGDYVDRGLDSFQVMEQLIRGSKDRKWKWVCLMGNHESMMLNAVRHKRQQNLWVGNGGAETLYSYVTQGHKEIPQKHLNWIQDLPLY